MNKFGITTVATIGIIIFLFSFNFTFASEITSENVINNINSIRKQNSLSELNVNPALQLAAYEKSVDMIVRNYFDHYAFGLTPWMFIKNKGYDYSIAGENLAMGFSTSEGVVNAWMNSPGHRANILNPEYEDIGVGVVKGTFAENGISKPTTMTTKFLAKPKSLSQTVYEKVINNIEKMFSK